jgi:hypothetical protein
MSLLQMAALYLVSTLMVPGSQAFQPHIHNNNNQRMLQKKTALPMVAPLLDPTELAHQAASIQHHMPSDVMTSTSSTWETILSTMYATTVDGLAQSSVADTTATTTGPSALSEAAQNLIRDGKLLDLRNDKMVSITAGFHEPGGILPKLTTNQLPPRGTTTNFFGQVKSSASMLNVLDKLPMAAFVYVLIDFFLLRPGMDLYKEDIEEDPTGALAETVAVTTVRLGVFALISFVTLAFFNHL